MFLTCARVPKTASKFRAVVFAVVTGFVGLLTLHAHAQAGIGEIPAPVQGAVTVSDHEFNTFVFGASIQRIFFPAGSPVVGEPIYLSDNTQIMIQFAKDSGKKPIQMVAELADGQVVTLRLQVKSVPGVTHAVNGARPKSANPRPLSGRGTGVATPSGEDIELLKHMVTAGEPPPGFDQVALPPPVRFDKFSAIPLAAWSDGMHKRVFVFSLVAAQGQTAVVTPPQFYRPGISAVMIDGDVADANSSPQLYVVEDINDE